MPLETLVGFALTCLLIEVTPGPNMAYLAVLSATHGRRVGLAATLGVALGLLLVGIAAAVGLAAVVSSSRWLYEAIRWGGIVYLLWLAWDAWPDAAGPAPVAAGIEDLTRSVFMRGLMTNLLNPKAAIFYVSVLPAFVDVARPVFPQTLKLTAIYVAVATVIHLSLVGLAGAVQPFLESPDRNRRVRRAMAIALAGIALWFAWNTAR
jgi:threonine/homoserine/homoserine lactone efflux protein